MRTLKRRWRHVVTITSLVVYVLTFAIPVAMPKVAKAETAGVYEVWGQVLIDNRPAHLGFTVRLKNKATGQEYWPKVENGEGWYRKPGVEAGTYLVTHYSTCPGNNNFDFTVREGSWTVPTISLRCNNPTPTPLPPPTYEVWGQVLIDNRPAQIGFAVRLKNKATGQEYWPQVENGDGWYRKQGVLAGTYLVTHYSTCPGNNNFDFTVGEGSLTVPAIRLSCGTPTPAPVPHYEVWGHVLIDGRDGHDGFTVRLKNKVTGQEYWPKVANGAGWYTSPRVDAGTYLITHYSTCPGNNNFEYTVGEGAQTVPEIRLSCGTPTPAPVPYYEVWGHVLIDGRDGQDGFTVRLKNKVTGQEYWPKVANGAGWYTSPRVDAGTYLITHYSTCPGNNNFEYTVGEGAQTVPEIRLSCAPQGSFSLSGRVYVDGQPAWSGFGVKAVKDGRVVWALADSNGYYSFQNLEAGSYSVGHVHPCATEGGNPITLNMDGNKTVDFRLKCVSEPSPTPEPPNPFPYVCGDGGGVRYRDFGLYESPEFLVHQGVGYRVTSIVKFDLEATACPEDTYQAGTPDSDVGLKLHGKYFDMTMSKRGNLRTNLTLNQDISPEFSCGDMSEITYMQSYVGSCTVGYNFAGSLLGSDIEVAGSIYVQFNFYLDGDQIGLKFALALGDIKNIVAQMNFQTATQTFVLIGSLTLFGVVQKYFLSITLLFPYLNIPDPGPVAASVASASLSNLTDEVQMTMGSYFATNSSLRLLDADWQIESSIKVHAAGFRPSGHAYLLVMKVGALSEGETALVEQVVAADASGVVDMVVDLPSVNTSVLVLLVDMENFATEFNAYLKQTIPDITFTGAVGVVHPRGGESISVYLPLIVR